MGDRESVEVQSPRQENLAHHQSGTEVSSEAEDREEPTEAASLSRATVEHSGLWATEGATSLAEEVISERSDTLPSCMWVAAEWLVSLL